MNRKTILPLIAATLVAALPLPAAAFDQSRANAHFQLVDDDDDDDRGGYWYRLDGRWVPYWASDDDDDRWDDDDWDDDGWGDDDDDDDDDD